MTLLNLTTGILMAASVVTGQGTTSSQSTIPLVRVEPGLVSEAKFVDSMRREAVAAYVKQYFIDTPVLAEVAFCESTFRQKGIDGKVLRGNVNTSDIGVMQINEFYHGKTADELGIDIHTLEGNVAYAKYLYEKEGLKPWRSSSKCWSQNLN